MSLQGNEEIVPAGISGDFISAAERIFPRFSGHELGRIAYFSELADRFENGAVSPEEEAELTEYLQRSVTHESL